VTADGEFYLPTRVFFGRGVAGQAGARAGGLGMHRVLLVLVTDPGVQAAGLAGPVRENLTAAGLEVVVFQQVEPNPRDTDCGPGERLIMRHDPGPTLTPTYPGRCWRCATWPGW
jgi:alcohol dehydrogenase class IV